MGSKCRILTSYGRWYIELPPGVCMANTERKENLKLQRFVTLFCMMLSTEWDFEFNRQGAGGKDCVSGFMRVIASIMTTVYSYFVLSLVFRKINLG